MEFVKLIFLLYVGSYLSLIVHEGGHHLAVRKCNIRPYNFVVGSGPEFYRLVFNKTKFSFKFWPTHGKVVYKRIVTYRQEISIHAAGPLANFGLAMLLFAAYVATNFKFLEIFSIMSIFCGVLNLFPSKGSDGAVIYKAWKNLNLNKKK